MIIKDPKKLAQRMMILSILICIIALAVAVMAVSMRQYLIAAGMTLVAIAQAWNYKVWQKKTR